MATFSNTSEKRLKGCHQDLQTILHYAIKITDFTVVSGHRPPAEQFELYKKGRTYNGTEWIVARRADVVTYKDGVTKLSRHNQEPSEAVDIAPYRNGIQWGDHKAFHELAGIIKATAFMLKKYDDIKTDI